MNNFKKWLFVLFAVLIASFNVYADSAKQVDFLLSGYDDPTSHRPLSGGKVWTFLDGTSTLAPVWTDKDKGGVATNPVILDSAGKAEIYGDNIYKFAIYDSDDALVEEITGLEYKTNTDISEDLLTKVTKIDTIADLRTYTGYTGESVQVLGYYTPGDGGGGPIRIWNIGPGQVDDGGSVIVPEGTIGSVSTVGAWVWQETRTISVDWYGAGLVADATSAIQAAIIYAETQTGTNLYTSAGSTVLFGSAFYNVTSTIYVTKSKIALVGSTVRPVVSTGENITMFQFGDPTFATQIYGNEIRNLLFKSLLDNTTTIGIDFYDTIQATLDNCWFVNWAMGVKGQRFNTATINNCWFRQLDRSTKALYHIGLFGRSTTGSTSGGNHITDCEFWGWADGVASTNASIYVASVDGLYVQNCHMYQNSACVLIEPDGTVANNLITDVIFDTCYFDQPLRSCVEIAGFVNTPEPGKIGGIYQDISFDNCTFRASALGSYCVDVRVLPGTATSPFRGVNVTDSRLRLATVRAIRVAGDGNGFKELQGLTIADCTFRENNTGGTGGLGTAIQVECESASITGNTFDQDNTPGSNLIFATLSPDPSLNPTLIITDNDFTKANNTGDSIKYSVVGGSTIEISGNMERGEGQNVNQSFKTSGFGTDPVTLYTVGIPVNQGGVMRVAVSGQSVDGTEYLITTIEAMYSRAAASPAVLTSVPTIVKEDKSAGMAAVTVTIDITSSVLTVTTTGVAAKTVNWSTNINLQTTP